MSIASKLQDILAAKADIKDAINAKGGSVTDATPLDEYAQAIEDLPSGGGDMISLIDGSIIEVNVEVGNIRAYAFSGCTSLIRVVITGTVTIIPSYMCSGCTSLQEVQLPQGVSAIRDSAFYQCAQLTEITIPPAVTSIGSNVFYGMGALQELVIPDSVTTIGNECARNCHSIQKVVLGTGLTRIGNNFLSPCNSTSYIIISNRTTPPTIGSNFVATNFAGRIYVPDASVNDYKTATNWSTYAAYIYPLSDYTP